MPAKGDQVVNQPEHIAMKEVRQRFPALFSKLPLMEQFMSDEDLVAVFDGDLSIDSMRELHVAAAIERSEYVASLIVVDGDLTVHGEVLWAGEPPGEGLLVTGSLNADVLEVTYCGQVAVGGDLELRSALFGYCGDDGGSWYAAGDLRAPYVVNTTYCVGECRGAIDAVIIVDSSYARDFAGTYPHYDINAQPEQFTPATRNQQGFVDGQLVIKLIRDGRPVLVE